MKRSMMMSLATALTLCLAPELLMVAWMVYVALLWDEVVFGKGN